MSKAHPLAGVPQIESATYTIDLVGEDLLEGSAELRLTGAGTSASMLPLEPCSLVIDKAAWQDDAKPASLGTGPDGKLYAQVEGSRLNCRWSQRGERTASAAINFRLDLPRSPLTRIDINAPRGLDVISDAGVATKAEGASPQTNRWTIELGAHSRVNLRVAAEGTAPDRRRLTLLRQATTYEFSPRGVNVVTQLKLDLHGEPLERIAVKLDPTLRPVAARVGELDVPFSVATDVETHASQIILQLPERIEGTGRVLQLSAMAPLVSGRHWRLPLIEPEGVSWQEGTATLVIPAALRSSSSRSKVAANRNSPRCRSRPAASQSKFSTIGRARPSKCCWPSRASGSRSIRARWSKSVRARSPAASRSRCRWRGSRHALVLGVRPNWLIDGVENLDANRGVEWEFDEADGGHGVLNLRLSQAVSAGNPARLLVRGHRALPNRPVLEGRQLEMLALDDMQRGARLIGVRAGEGSELHWENPEDLNPTDAAQLGVAQLQLFAQPPTGTLFAEDAVFARSTAGLERRKPRFSADIRIDVAVQNARVTETYAIGCVPETARVERVLIRFSHAREAPLEWSLAGGTSGQFSARKLTAGEQAQRGLAPGGEAWEVGLFLARGGPFELPRFAQSRSTARSPSRSRLWPTPRPSAARWPFARSANRDSRSRIAA